MKHSEHNHKLSRYLELSSGSTRPHDITPERTQACQVPVFGGNGCVGWSSKSLESGDQVIIGRVGEKCGVVHFHSGDCWITDNALYVTAYLLPSSPRYFAYLLDQTDLNKTRSKGGQPLVTQGGILSLVTFVPPLPEQRKIADILTTWDEALTQLDTLIEAQERRKKALMQQVLTGKKRMPGFREKWKRVSLGEVLEPITRTVTKPEGAFLAAGIRSHGKGVFLKPEFKPADISLDELFELKAGDLVVNITFAWEGAAAIVPPDADGALVSHRFPTFGFREGQAATSFFRHYIRTKRFVFDCGLASPGGAGRNRVLSKSAFLDIELLLPPFEEQEKIGALLDTADQQLTLLRTQRTALDQQKRGLMQRLLTGKLRVRTA